MLSHPAPRVRFAEKVKTRRDQPTSRSLLFWSVDFTNRVLDLVRIRFRARFERYLAESEIGCHTLKTAACLRPLPRGHCLAVTAANDAQAKPKSMIADRETPSAPFVAPFVQTAKTAQKRTKSRPNSESLPEQDSQLRHRIEQARLCAEKAREAAGCGRMEAESGL